MRYPLNAHRKELAAAEGARERERKSWRKRFRKASWMMRIWEVISSVCWRVVARGTVSLPFDFSVLLLKKIEFVPRSMGLSLRV